MKSRNNPRKSAKSLQERALKRLNEPIRNILYGIIASVIATAIVALCVESPYHEPTTSEPLFVGVFFILLVILLEYVFIVYYKKWKEAALNLIILDLLGCFLMIQTEIELRSQLIKYIALIAIFSFVFCSIVSRFPPTRTHKIKGTQDGQE